MLTMNTRPEPYPKTLYSSGEAAQKLDCSRQYLSVLKRHPKHKLRYFRTRAGDQFLVREVEALARILDKKQSQSLKRKSV